MPTSRRFVWRFEAALGANLAADPATWAWTDVTPWVRPGASISRGFPDQFSAAPPSVIDAGLLNDGRWVARNPTGPWYGLIGRNTPIRVVYVHTDGDHVQGTGFIDKLPLRWADTSLTQSYVDAAASGVQRRILQQRDLQSALFRAHARGAGVIDYWPMEDSSGSTSFASGLAGGLAAPFVDVQPSSSATAGSGNLPVFGGASHVLLAVRTYPAATTWCLRFVCKIPASPATDAQILSWLTPGGTIARWQVTLVPGSPDRVRIDGYDSSGVIAYIGPAWDFVDGTSGSELTNGRQLYFTINAAQSGLDISIDWNVWYQPDAYRKATSINQLTTVVGSAMTNVSGLYFDGVTGFGTGGVVLGHVAIGIDPTLGDGSIGATGGAGETTTARFARLCAEQSIPARVGEIGITPPATRQEMGPQPTIDFKDQFADIADTELGLLFDGKDGRLQLVGRDSRYNHPVAMTLRRAAGEVGWPFEPQDDDFALRNSVSVGRRAGSLLAVAADEAAIATQGEYNLPATINPLQDTAGRDHAAFRLALGTVDEMRYPRITLDLTRAPQLIAQWLACDIGSRIQVTGVPTQGGLPPDDLDLVLIGYTEHIDSMSWLVEMNCAPASPWQAFVVEAGVGNRGRVGTSGAALVGSYAASATSLRVGTTTPGARWGTATPYDWLVSGERMTVTSMATVTPAFVAAGTAAHADNAAVTPGLPAGATTGDLLLIFAATRGLGSVATPAGYTVLLDDTRVRLFGKIHTGTESAPSVSPSGGSSGDTMSAQMAAFRGVQLQAARTAVGTNVAAQNILVPAALPPRHRCLVLWLGWKQDDWTSVATFAGTEIGEPSSTLGSDQGLVWDYQIQTTATEVASGAFTVTGGASAASSGYVVWLPTDVQTATVTRAVNGVSKAQTADTAVQLWRPGRVAL